MQFVRAFSLLEKLVHFVNQHQPDRLAFVNDTLCVVDAVGAGEIDGIPVFQKRDFHWADRNLEQPFVQPQPPDGALDFLVYRFPQLVMPLPDNDRTAVRVPYQLENSFNRRRAGFRPRTAGGQYFVRMHLVIEYIPEFFDEDITEPDFVLCH